MATIFISIGSNINAHENIRLALDDLGGVFSNILNSTYYESEAVGFDGDNFINLVTQAETNFDIPTVAEKLHAIEDQHGRDRSGPKFSSRTIDLDLLLYDDAIYENGKLQIPRDEILTNAFVLWPLAELIPDKLHPVMQQSYGDLWQKFDKSSQSLWPI